MAQDYKGLDYLRRKLAQKRTRVRLRYRYYEGKQIVRDFGISTPKALRGWMSTLGWCARGVDALADRLQFRGFAAGGDDPLDLDLIYQANNADVLYDASILGALISSCDFLYIHAGPDGYPVIDVIDGGNATGVIDPSTQLLTEGYAVLESDKSGRPTVEAYFTADCTEIHRAGSNAPERYKNPAPYPLLVPVIYRPDAVRPFGHSRITRACMDIMAAAIRTIKRSEISAEFYSFPQKYVLGLSNDNIQKFDKDAAAMSSMLTFGQDRSGNKPTVGQFTVSAQTPHLDQLRSLASLFAGETGLTLDDLGFVSENPSSSEAIKAAHENLRVTARKAQRGFNVAFLNAGYLAACVRDNYAYSRHVIALYSPAWEPVFEPDASTLSLIGDGAIKINQAIPGYFGEGNLRNLTGIPSDSETS